MGVYFNSGQVCCAGTRIFVQRDRYDEVVGKLANFSKGVTMGDPFDQKSTLGPLVSREQFDRVKGYLEVGKKEGAKVSAGGTAGTGKGYFVNPTLFSDVKNDMQIAREEIFGPVGSAISFTDENDAVFQGNNTDYGLSAAVWTRDISRAHKVARSLKAGTVWVNCYNQLDPISPFGGYKQSGFGRELGRYAIDLYTQIKSVWMKL
jgi:acyl-CoA reductase-like NAD-dependent aldehyde dehydrogenase